MQGDSVCNGMEGAGFSLVGGSGFSVDSEEAKDADQAMRSTRSQRLASWTEVRTALRGRQDHQRRGSMSAANGRRTGRISEQKMPDLPEVGFKATLPVE